MNAYLNYLTEANLGLCLFFMIYLLLLRKETDFRIKRSYAISTILASLIFPLFHFNAGNSVVPSISTLIPSYWLPEVVVYGKSPDATIHESLTNSFTVWDYIFVCYGSGVLIMLSLFIFRLISLLRKLKGARFYSVEKYRVIESPKDQSSFSFFRFIFIGQADRLTNDEKQQIIKHELVHARQYHSFDILLINVLNVFFWFNPILTMYKKTFVQLHEFEADARAVENSDVNEYCSLLARVALLSADFKLANHFSNSLTVKRIEMMRTIKTKITRWKIMVIALIVPLFFTIVACQDQVSSDLAEIARNSNHALVAPENVQARYEQLKREKPNSNYLLIQFNEKAEQKLAEMEKTYGLPKSIELFTPDGETMKGEGLIKVEPGKTSATKAPTYAIIEYNESVAEISDLSKMDGEVFTVVEQQPEYADGGFNGLGAFLGSEIKYPDVPREAGIEGTVFTSFIVEKDGTVSNAEVMKSVEPHLDAEALRVVKLTKWTPGKQNGRIVRVKFVLPIKYKL